MVQRKRFSDYIRSLELRWPTRSPVNALNLESTSGSFLRDKVMTSEPSDILLLISRKILSTLSSSTVCIKQNS